MYILTVYELEPIIKSKTRQKKKRESKSVNKRGESVLLCAKEIILRDLIEIVFLVERVRDKKTSLEGERKTMFKGMKSEIKRREETCVSVYANSGMQLEYMKETAPSCLSDHSTTLKRFIQRKY